MVLQHRQSMRLDFFTGYFYCLHTSKKLISLQLQVLCWGVRDMKHYLLLPVDSPLVEVECGGVVQRSQHIEDTRKNPNFPNPLIHFEVVSNK